MLMIIPWSVAAQTQNTPDQLPFKTGKLDEIVVAPSRLELEMLPGTEKTVVVNLIFTSVTGKSEPTRLVASLNDWSLSKDARIEYHRAGTLPNSACPWMIYSPAEVTVEPGRTYPVRVTISVPKDARPGDHLAALIVEPRPDNIKLEEKRRQVQLRFRMAAIFYIMVPRLTRKGSLQGLRAATHERGIIVTPTLRNEGNSRIRPLHIIKVADGKGTVVAELVVDESLPVLGGSEIDLPLLIEKRLPAGSYAINYRVNLGEGGRVAEGRTELIVRERLAQEPTKEPPAAVSAVKNQQR
jgi:hypothetical protein